MITYVPFLKAKINEIKAVGELAPNVRAAISPFFDYPRKPGLDGLTFEVGVEKLVRRLEKHIGVASEFYFDNYDLPDTLRVGTKHSYEFLMENLAHFAVIPVISVDRSQAHLDAVTELKERGNIQSDTVAFRVTPEYFEDYSVIDLDIASDLASVFGSFKWIDLIFDCRVCTEFDASSVASQMKAFSSAFCSTYPVRRVIVTGSSIPASAGDILSVQTTRMIPRHELEIYRAARQIHNHAPLIFGDYATVSPLYSDVDIAPQILQSTMTAKFAYTLNGSHFFIRGAGLRTKGYAQYFGMAKTLCSQPFFRGAGYSAGDGYFYQKSRGQGANCTPNTVIKPAVNSHISYTVLSGTV